MELSERKKRILRSIIDEYIDRGEPVGSKHLVLSGGISLSPATIRNEMSDLEEMGYLDKPHASSGRVPSTSAYRLYAENLMQEYRDSAEELELLSELTRFKSDEMDKLVERARKVISAITGYATVTVSGENDASVIARYETLLIDKNSLLLVMVTPDGKAKTEQLAAENTLTSADAAGIKAALNLVLAGKDVNTVALPEIMRLEELFGAHRSLVNPILRASYAAVHGSEAQIGVDGISNLLSFPEFHSTEKVKDLIGLFEQGGENLKTMLPTQTEGDRTVKIYVGDETDGTSDASMVFCSVPVGKTNTVFGILGPRRMDYKKAAEALTRLSRTLETMSDESE